MKTAALLRATRRKLGTQLREVMIAQPTNDREELAQKLQVAALLEAVKSIDENLAQLSEGEIDSQAATRNVERVLGQTLNNLRPRQLSRERLISGKMPLTSLLQARCRGGVRQDLRNSQTGKSAVGVAGMMSS